MPWFRWQGETLIIDLRVQPRASRDEIAGPQGPRLKVRITAPPVDGKANAHLLKLLAKQFRVPRSAVRLMRGENGRDKRIAIDAPQHLPSAMGITAGDKTT